MEYVSGPVARGLASIRFPPGLEILVSVDNPALNYPQIDMDWEFFTIIY